VPAPAAPAPPWQLSAVLRSSDFQSVSLSFALGLMVQVGFLTHQVAYLSPILGSIATRLGGQLDDALGSGGPPPHRPHRRQVRPRGRSHAGNFPGAVRRNSTARRKSIGADALSRMHSSSASGLAI